MIIILNLTKSPLSPQQLDAVRTTTLDRVHVARRDVARGLVVREVSRMIYITTLEWQKAAVIPWVDVRMPEARALLDAANEARGYNWPIGVTVGASWWVIHGWEELEGIVDCDSNKITGGF